ncbi:MAG: hypothetical protein ACKO3T_09960, partial [Planctomycetaceae bacterium]
RLIARRIDRNSLDIESRLLPMNEKIWLAVIGLYALAVIVSFIPSWKAFRAPVAEKDVDRFIKTANTAFDTAPQFDDIQRTRLKSHYARLAGTLVFWKVNAHKYKMFHYYCLIWTIPSAVLIPVLTQAISDDSLSKAFVTVLSAYTAVLLAFHRGFKIEDNHKAFRHGESEYHDLYRRLLDNSALPRDSVNATIDSYIAETESIRRFVRNAETSNLATLDEAKNLLAGRKSPQQTPELHNK